VFTWFHIFNVLPEKHKILNSPSVRKLGAVSRGSPVEILLVNSQVDKLRDAVGEEEGRDRVARQLVDLLGVQGHVDQDEGELHEEEHQVHGGVHLLHEGTAAREVVHEQAGVLHRPDVGHQVGDQARVLARLHRGCHPVERRKLHDKINRFRQHNQLL